MRDLEREILRGALAYIAVYPIEDTRSALAIVRAFQLISAKALARAKIAQSEAE